MNNEVLKTLQNIEYNILCKIDSFCRKHEIKYSLYAGTALGAVRHGGFIPWDDDIDIAMTRIEFDRFCKLWEQDPIKGYYLESVLTDNKCGTCHAKVRKDGTVLLSKGEIEEVGHHGVWIDIFPLDKVAHNERIRAKKNKIGREMILLTRANVNNTNDSFKKKAVRGIFRLIPDNIRQKRVKNLHKWLIDHMDDGIENGYDWKSMSTFDNIDHLSFSSDLDSGYTSIAFGEGSFLIFENYTDMLERTYGDYMELPPVEKRVCTHNPVKIQL